VAHALVRAASTLVSMLVHSADLNASIHVRALLTDLFLIDEILKWGQESPMGAAGSATDSGSLPPSLAIARQHRYTYTVCEEHYLERRR
jgi:hypothetical protein